MQKRIHNFTDDIPGNWEDLGHTVKEVELPITDQLMDDFKYLWGMSTYFVKKFGKSVIQAPFDASKLSKLTHGLSDLYAKNMFKTPFFVRRLKRTNRLHDDFFKSNKIDILLSLTMTHATPKHGYIDMSADFDEVFPRMEKWACITPFLLNYWALDCGTSLKYVFEEEIEITMPFKAFISKFGRDN